MKRAIGFGLVLLTMAASSARAGGIGSPATGQGSDGVAFFLGAAAAPPTRTAQGYLGVDVRDVAPDQVSPLKLKDARGAEIVLVDHDAPAGKAGLREHDVVLQMNGQAIDGRDQIRRMLHDSPPGKSITLIISRDGQQINVTTQMATQEEVERQASEQRLPVRDPQATTSDNTESASSPAPTSSGPPMHGNSFVGTLLMNPSYTGAMLEKMSSQQAAYFGVPSGAGLLVRTVVPNSPAAIAGLQVCDVIVRADAKPVSSTGDWAKAIKNSRGKPLAVVVLRDKKEQTLTLTPDSKKRSSIEQLTQDSAPVSFARLGLSWLPRS
jgi:serine protease Do